MWSFIFQCPWINRMLLSTLNLSNLNFTIIFRFFIFNYGLLEDNGQLFGGSTLDYGIQSFLPGEVPTC